MPNVKILPSLLCAPPLTIDSVVEAALDAGVDGFHFDVMDGHFVPNLALSPHLFIALKDMFATTFEVHLMVNQAKRFIPLFPQAHLFSIHIENHTSIDVLLDSLKISGYRTSIAINPETSPHILNPFLSKIDQVLVMTVKPGWGGQTFLSDQLKKIHYLHTLRTQRNLSYEIAVDGGINLETGKAAVLAGANTLIIGSFFFQHATSDYKLLIQKFRDLHG